MSLKNIQFGYSTYDPVTKIWSGPKSESLCAGDISIGKVILDSFNDDPDYIVQICHHNGKQYTSREMALLSIRVAQHFEAMNLPQCTVIGICAANTDYIAPLFYGAMLNGLTIHALDPTFEKPTIQHMYAISKPKLIFCDGSVYAKMHEALTEMNMECKYYTMQEHISGVAEMNELLAETGTELDYKPQPLQYGCSQTAVILSSSGTTGLPKGTCISHAMLGALDAGRKLRYRALLLSSLYWVSSQIGIIQQPLQGFTRVITKDPFNPEMLFEIIEKQRITLLFTTPSQMASAVASNKHKNYDLSSLQIYLTSGSTVPLSTVNKMRSCLPNAEIFSAYGMAEIAGGMSAGVCNEIGIVGQLLKNREVKIINSEGQTVGPGERGEICVRIPFKWAGYYGSPKETAETLDSDGWIHTGDLGYFSDDGNLFVFDRIKQIIKYNTYPVVPSQIEEQIAEIPGVVQVCVCGLPDEICGSLPAAAIVKAHDSQLTEAEVFEYVAQRMDSYNKLRGGVYFVEDLPLGPSDKVIRKSVAEICEKLRQQRDQPK